MSLPEPSRLLFQSIFFAVGIFRFYIPIINENNILIINIIILCLLLFTFIFYFIKFNNFENFLTFVTGTIIFLPACFVDKPLHAIVMGVTMHYSQYLVLTFKVCRKREREIYLNNLPTFLGIKNYKYIFTVFFYAIIMSILSLSGKFEESFLKNLIIIPIIGQMLHFYLDSQLWKFSEPHNRKFVLRYIK